MALARANKRNGCLTLLVATVVALAGCTTQFDREYAATEQWRTAAAEAGYEWIETGKLLEEAREQEARGNREAAFALLAKARFQAEAAIKQAEHEADAWRGRVVR